MSTDGIVNVPFY